MSRREYRVSLKVNGIQISKVIVDSHYEEKHKESINDELILRLVQKLNGSNFEAESVDGSFSYFVADKLELEAKYYRLVWLLEKDEIYIGVVNAYRRRI